MATILRTTNGQDRLSPFYYAAFNYRAADGRIVRVKKSTGTADKKEAQLIANDLELRATELAKGRLTVTRMREALMELTERITGEAVADYTTETWLREWLSQKAAVTKPGTLKRYRGVINSFITFLGNKARSGIEHVRPADVRAFRQRELDAGKSAHSCNLDVKCVSMPFRKARNLGIIKTNPAEGVETLDTDTERRSPFTLDQVRDVLTHAPDDEWRGLVLMGFYSGARLGDCARLVWDSVDLHHKILRFKPEKTTRGNRGKEIVIPMHPALHTFLMKLESPDDPTAFVFPTLAAIKLPGYSGLSRRFQAIMVKAGISAPIARARGKALDGKRSAGRSVVSLTFHSLRHTLTSLLHNAGVSAELRMQVTGHATEESHERYTHTAVETLRNALDKVPSL